MTEDINATIQNLALGSGDSLGINNGITLTIKGSSISNSGSFSINGGNAVNAVLNIGGNATLAGGGTMTLASAGGQAIIQGGGFTLTNSNNVIQGYGTIGNGTLSLSNAGSFIPAIGATFKIMNFSAETGTFSTVNGTAINSSEHFRITYQPTDVLLTVVAGAAPAVQPSSNFLPLPIAELGRGALPADASSQPLVSSKNSARSNVLVALNEPSRVPDQDSIFALLVIALLGCAFFYRHSTSF